MQLLCVPGDNFAEHEQSSDTKRCSAKRTNILQQEKSYDVGGTSARIINNSNEFFFLKRQKVDFRKH